MSSNVDCPYCGTEEIETEEHEEGVYHKQECPKCGKIFVYQTYIEISCTSYRADCLNGSEHKLKKISSTSPVMGGMRRWRCTDCGEEILKPAECNHGCKDLSICWKCEDAK